MNEYLSPLRWQDDALELLDQRLLPTEETWLTCRTHEEVARAIKDMVVRGAPAIGVAAAYGMAIAARTGVSLDQAAELLRATRPTAVNLFWAIDAMLHELPASASALPYDMRAHAIHTNDVMMCVKIGEHGAPLLPPGGVLTHCNAGALATGGYGTALGVIRAAIAAKKDVRVLASETRPLLQGARLTAWELTRDRIPVTLVTDSMVASIMARGEIDAVVVGADRIAKNGDVANKIGTYGHAVVAAAHGIPFYVAAPWSTVDLACESGASIPIEERAQEEVLALESVKIAPAGVPAKNPAFDVTPAKLIRAIYTERGATSPAEIGSLA